MTKKEIYKQFSCSAPTLSRIIKDKDDITRLAQQNKNISKKRLRKGCSKEVENALLIWFKEMRSKEAILTGPLLLEKAQYFADMLNVEFVPKGGWLERWKKRENIHFKNVHGEKSSADAQSATEWLRNILPSYLEEYPEDAIYNADESALFYKAVPSGTLANKSEKVSGRKVPKDRITLLFIANSTGTDKHLYSIGKSKNPRCFKKNNPIPVKYMANTKAWMTSDIWTKIIKELDTKFKEMEKKVLLFVDNAACHKVVDGTILENLKIVFLPANTTSLIQPLDQGIIRSFKSYYRKSIVAKQLLHLECGFSLKEFAKNMDLFDALKMVKVAWGNVTPETICNCFRKAGFIPGINIDTTDERDELSEALGDEIDYLLDIDENIDCFGELTDEDIIEQVTSLPNEEESNDDILIECSKPTTKEALESIYVLNDYFVGNSDALQNLHDLEQIMCKAHLENLNQMKIKDYFK